MLAAPGCMPDECDDVGASWCEGEMLHDCHPGGNLRDWPANHVVKTDCTRNEQENYFCVEWTDSSGGEQADCVWSTSSCDMGVDSFCADNALIECDETIGSPIAFGPCDQGSTSYCVGSPDGKQAACSPWPTPCTPGWKRCQIPEQPQTQRVRTFDVCSERGFWEGSAGCEDEKVCQQVSDDEIECIDPQK